MAIELTLEGLHPTTVSCLEMMQNLRETQQFTRVLDMGCGGGILSAVAAHWWGAQVTAADIDAKAVADTQALAQAQALEQQVRAVRSDGFSNPAIAQGGPYDLIIFNLLAEPIVSFAPQVKAHLAAGGMVVLSGILAWLAPQVKQAYEGLGFSPLHSQARGPWQTMLWGLPVS